MDLAIQKELEEIENDLDFLVDEGTLEAELADANKPTFKQLSEFQLKEDELVKELEELKNLWVVGNFIKEIDINIEMYELESVNHSLNKLASKIELLSNKDIIPLAIEKLNKLNSDFKQLLIKVWRQLLVINDTELIFNAEIEIDGTLIQYQDFIDLVHKFNLLDLNISKTLDDSLINKLVSNQYTFNLNDNRILINNSKPKIDEIISSIVSIINFISQIPENSKIIQYISNEFYDWLKLAIIDNIELIYNNDELKSNLLNLNEFLISHGFKRNDLKIWINSDLNEFILTFYLNNSIDEARSIVNNLDINIFNDLVTKDGTDTSTPKSEVKPQANHDDDDDGWDAWDEDIEFDEEKDEKPKSDDEIDDDWDAWDDEEEEVKKPTKLVSKLNKTTQASNNSTNSYSISKIPDLIKPIIKNFVSKKHKIAKSYLSNFTENLNILIESIYLILFNFYAEKFLLYNDLKYLYLITKIETINEISENLLTESVKEKENEIFNIFKELKELNPSLNSTITFNIISDIDSHLKKFNQNLKYLNPGLRDLIIISSINSIYQLIINSIYNRLSIGEDESEYLSIIISKFLNLSVLKDLDVVKIQNFNKIKQIQIILNNHLADIMNSFYNAEFFDLSTDELIGLIDKLFADSDLKRKYIQEILEIRQAD